MWRRTYLLLLLVRVYFALRPSYLHPDENFQGPEVIAGYLFSYPSHRTWEWTVAQPVRSVFPLWLFYGLPMTLLQWVWAKNEAGDVSPEAIYYTLRIVMFVLSFVLEDWAIHELVHSPRYRRQTVVLVASSYVTWTFQTHTFSNSIETILVLWSLVLIDRVAAEQKRSSVASSVVLGFVLVLGVFNRITFPAFVMIPGMRLLPRFLDRPLSFSILSVSVLIFAYVAVATDTAFYRGSAATASFSALFGFMRTAPVITPLNNLRYNTQTSNLAEHGLHPHYQHFIVNIPQLLGPALILLINQGRPFSMTSFKAMLANTRFASAATGTMILSLIPHQESRFLLPCVPLLLSCLKLPVSFRSIRVFWIIWIVFNTFMGLLMGIYHQGGIVPAQLAIPDLISATALQNNRAQVYWWKTYPPPTYVLGTPPHNAQNDKPINITTTSLMGLSQSNLISTLSTTVDTASPSCESGLFSFLPSWHKYSDIYLAAPYSAWRPEHLPSPQQQHSLHRDITIRTADVPLRLTHLYTAPHHINLDDMDFGDDGIWATLVRVVGRRGLGVWKVQRLCEPKGRREAETALADAGRSSSMFSELDDLGQRNLDLQDEPVASITSGTIDTAPAPAEAMSMMSSGLGATARLGTEFG